MKAREKYVDCGPRVFGDVDLIALLVGTGTAKRSAMEIAATLLSTFDGLSGLAVAEVSQ